MDQLSMMNAARRPRGQLAGRYLKALASGKGRGDRESFVLAQRHWSESDRSLILSELKAAVSPLTTGDAVAMTGAIATDFSAVVAAQAILSRLPGVTRAPLRTRMVIGASGATADWVGQGEPIPMSALDFDALGALNYFKIAGSAVTTIELSLLSDPDSDTVVAQDLARAVAAQIDRTAFDPSNTGSGARPPSLASAGTQFSSSGSTAAQIAADLKLMLAAVGVGDTNPANWVWVLRPSSAAHISTLRDTAGGPAFPGSGFGPDSRLIGLPMLVSTGSVTSGSPNEGSVSLVDGGAVLVGDDGATSLDATSQATVQMSDSPSSSASNQVSLWQNNLVGLKAIRYIDWKLRRASGMAVLTDVGY